MSEPTKENPKTSKRSKRKPAMEPLGWDEIVSQPGMGGYLSFLNGPVPLPHLQGSAPALAPNPEVISNPRVETTPEAVSSPDMLSTPETSLVSGGPQTAQAEIIPDFPTSPGHVSDPAVVANPGVDRLPGAATIPGSLPRPIVINDLGFVCPSPEVSSTPRPAATPDTATASSPEVVSIPAVAAGRIRIRRCAATHDGHSLGEEVLYQAIWKAARPESAETRTIAIGWRGMSQLCRMTPKNCKINTQRLMRKLALEVLSPYNTPESIGTTYRVYSDQAILERRRAAGLEWVVRSRGVEFVNPATGVCIMPICAHTH